MLRAFRLPRSSRRDSEKKKRKREERVHSRGGERVQMERRKSDGRGRRGGENSRMTLRFPSILQTMNGSDSGTGGFQRGDSGGSDSGCLIPESCAKLQHSGYSKGVLCLRCFVIINCT